MNTFIELTDKNGRPVLINTRNITSVVLYTEPDEELRIYVIGDCDCFVRVKETYKEVKRKLADVPGSTVV